MTDPLDPTTEPTGVSAGIPRLSKRILGIVFGAVVVVLTVLVFSIFQRADRANPPALTDSPTAPVDESAAEPASISVPGYTTPDAEIPAAPPTAPPTDEVPDLPEYFVLDERQQRIEEERADLFRDALFARTSIATPAPPGQPAPTAAPFPNVADFQPGASPRAALTTTPAGPDQPSDPNLRARKDTFAAADRAPAPEKIYTSPPSATAATELRPGTIIPALLVTGINTDLPGQLIAQVSRDIRDSLTGDRVLVPAGSRLIGTYDSHVAFGQRRALVVWSQIHRPDGSTIAIRNMPGVDPSGRAGFSDKVNNHYFRTFAGATMLSVISAGAQLSQPDRPAVDQSGRHLTAEEQLAADLGRQWAEVGRELVNRNLDVQPSLTIRPGYRFRVVVTRDLVVPPWTS